LLIVGASYIHQPSCVDLPLSLVSKDLGTIKVILLLVIDYYYYSCNLAAVLVIYESHGIVNNLQIKCFENRAFVKGKEKIALRM